MKVTLDLLNPHFIVSCIFILLIVISSIYGDSSKKTAWMFFMTPILFAILLLYWLFILTNIWVIGVVLSIFAVSAILKRNN